MTDVAGKSVLDLLWEHLDDFVDAVQEPVNQDEADNAKGRAHGMAVAIAVVMNPYAPDVPEVKQAAMDRWTDRQEARTQNERVDEEPVFDSRARKSRAERLDRRAARQARRAARNS